MHRHARRPELRDACSPRSARARLVAPAGAALSALVLAACADGAPTEGARARLPEAPRRSVATAVPYTLRLVLENGARKFAELAPVVGASPAPVREPTNFSSKPATYVFPYLIDGPDVLNVDVGAGSPGQVYFHPFRHRVGVNSGDGGNADLVNGDETLRIALGAAVRDAGLLAYSVTLRAVGDGSVRIRFLRNGQELGVRLSAPLPGLVGTAPQPTVVLLREASGTPFDAVEISPAQTGGRVGLVGAGGDVVSFHVQ